MNLKKQLQTLTLLGTTSVAALMGTGCETTGPVYTEENKHFIDNEPEKSRHAAHKLVELRERREELTERAIRLEERATATGNVRPQNRLERTRRQLNNTHWKIKRQKAILEYHADQRNR